MAESPMTAGKRLSAAVAFIEEPACIGCALCIEACPVDAIVGARGWMHTVLAAECTGCGWCVPVCPVDCVKLATAAVPHDRESRRERAARYRRRYFARRDRLERERRACEAPADPESRQAAVERAMQRARERLRNGDR